MTIAINVPLDVRNFFTAKPNSTRIIDDIVDL